MSVSTYRRVCVFVSQLHRSKTSLILKRLLYPSLTNPVVHVIGYLLSKKSLHFKIVLGIPMETKTRNKSTIVNINKASSFRYSHSLSLFYFLFFFLSIHIICSEHFCIITDHIRQENEEQVDKDQPPFVKQYKRGVQTFSFLFYFIYFILYM